MWHLDTNEFRTSTAGLSFIFYEVSKIKSKWNFLPNDFLSFIKIKHGQIKTSLNLSILYIMFFGTHCKINYTDYPKQLKVHRWHALCKNAIIKKVFNVWVFRILTGCVYIMICLFSICVNLYVRLQRNNNNQTVWIKFQA